MMAACSSDGVFYEQSTNQVTLVGLKNESRVLLGLDPYVNDAAVVFSLWDVGGDVALPDVWPLSMPYVAGSNGTYSAAVPVLESTTEGEIWQGEVKALSGGLERVWPLSVEIA